MKNNNISPELQKLISSKSDICVSMILPLHKMPSDKKIDEIMVNHALSKLKALMTPNYDAATVAQFVGKLSFLKEEVRHITGVKGIGIFMSADLFHTVTFPFDVNEKIHVGKTFEVRDVLYKELYLKEYMVLSLTGNEVKLYKGSGSALTEVQDHNFPAAFYNHDYAVPVLEAQVDNPSQPMKRMKSEIMESSQSFYNTLDKKLLDYVLPDQPLILAGVEKEISAFELTTLNRGRIKGHVIGSYNNYITAHLEQKAWEVYQDYLKKEEEKTLASLPELFGRELLSIGISDVWRNAKMGKGNVLVVERDLSQPAFTGNDEFQIWLSPPQGEHEIISDAVDDVIETVLEKNGKVVFVDNGKLKEFQGIALITRY